MNMTILRYIDDYMQAVLQQVAYDPVDKNLHDKFKTAVTELSYGGYQIPNLDAVRKLTQCLQNKDLFHIVNAYVDACEHMVKDAIDIAGQTSRKLITAERDKLDIDIVGDAYIQLEAIFDLCQDNNAPVTTLREALFKFQHIAEKFDTTGLATVMGYAQHMLKLAKMLG